MDYVQKKRHAIQELRLTTPTGFDFGYYLTLKDAETFEEELGNRVVETDGWNAICSIGSDEIDLRHVMRITVKDAPQASKATAEFYGLV